MVAQSDSRIMQAVHRVLCTHIHVRPKFSRAVANGCVAAEAGFTLFEESYSDYRKVADLIVPHKIVVKTNGKIFIESELTRFETNKELPTDFFYKK